MNRELLRSKKVVVVVVLHTGSNTQELSYLYLSNNDLFQSTGRGGNSFHTQVISKHSQDKEISKHSQDKAFCTTTCTGVSDPVLNSHKEAPCLDIF